MHIPLFIPLTLRKTSRKARRAALWGSMRLTHRKRIIVGAGSTRYPGWISTDIDVLNILDRFDWQRYFQPGSIDAILAEHVWEHLTPDQAIAAAENCYIYLKQGGYLRIAVPDGFHPDLTYSEYVKPGGTGVGAVDHKVLYEYRALRDLFLGVGFKVALLEYYDENGVFNELDWKPTEGPIIRSWKYDIRNKDEQMKYTSIILDAKKQPL